MAENIPPTSANTAHPSSSTDQIRGLPYYEKLKKDLRETLQNKRVLDKSISQLEDQIYRYETSYIEETSAGNIIKGFDNYIKGSGAVPGSGSVNAGGGSGGSGGPGGGGGGTSTRRKGGMAGTEEWRVFSKSSASFMKELSPPSSAHVSPPGGTPTTATGGAEKSATGVAALKNGRGDETPTSASSLKTGGGQKKKRGERGDEDEDASKGNKRLKVNFSRVSVGD